MGEDSFFPVHSIVNKRLNLKNYVEEFLIRWEGYSSKYDEWRTEEDCLPSCYSLILEFEIAEYKKLRERQPKIIALRKDCQNKIRLLMESQSTNKAKEQWFIYSSVIRRFDPHVLIDYYEKNISFPDANNELAHFHQSLKKKEEIDENAEPHKIIAVVDRNDERLLLITCRNNDEAFIVDDSYVKLKYPELLVKFFEKHLIVKK